MNKAFVREPDATTSHCPRCGSLGQPVLPETLSAQLQPDAAGAVSSGACFCPHPTCEVAYFDDLDRIVTVAALRHPVYPRIPDAPICPCFQVTCDELREDAEAGIVERVRNLIARANSNEARCQTASPSGRSCIAEVQRFYLKCRAR